MAESALVQELARDNVELHRRVAELEQQVVELVKARETVHFHDLERD